MLGPYYTNSVHKNFITKQLDSRTLDAVALSRVLRTALVPYGNMETSTLHSSKTSQVITIKLCKFDYVRKTNTCVKFGWNPPVSYNATLIYNWGRPFRICNQKIACSAPWRRNYDDVISGLQ